MAPSRDALQRIGAINGEVEKMLGAHGVNRFTQIAGWSPAEIERFDRLLGSQGRITRENWIEQAQILAKGGDTAHSREYDRRQLESQRDASVRPKSITEAIKANAGAAAAVVAASVAPVAAVAAAVAPSAKVTPTTTATSAPSVTPASPLASRPDIAGLRSVRSEAYRPSPAEIATAAAAAAGVGSARVVRSAEIDDLKRIRGIGVLIEKRLNSVGIVSYGQIADWTTDDIDRVSASLDFKGRIERENWVEQARILSAGGQTEFSRRVDRGEVETSKSR
jgi:predicted flap endonuclease-1-like 5' DNA nuclease